MLALTMLACTGGTADEGPKKVVEPSPAATRASPAPAAPTNYAGTHTPFPLARGSQRLAVADLDGDGHAEIVRGDLAKLRVLRADGTRVAEVDAPGGAQAMAVAGQRVLVGWGRTKQHPDAEPHVAAYRLDGSALVGEDVLPATAGVTQVVGLAPGADDIVVAYARKSAVQLVRARVTGTAWALRDLAEIKTAFAFAQGDVDGDGAAELVVGRIYGDNVGLPGEAFALRTDGSHAPIPSTGGVRAVAVADTDGDGSAEVFLADGWDRDYAHKAHARLSWARWDGSALRSELIEEVAGQSGFSKLVAADVDGDGAPEIVGAGNKTVRVWHRNGERWVGVDVAGASGDVGVGDLDGQPGAELVVGGKGEVISLRGVAWPSG